MITAPGNQQADVRSPFTQSPAGPEFSANTAIGQHFLLDPSVLTTAADLVPEGSNIIEIGPGPGTLTEYLVRRGNVTAYEVDERFSPRLDAIAADSGNLAVRWASILDAPIEDLQMEPPAHIVGNIPFHISEPLMRKLTDVKFASAVLLVGNNLVKSMTAPNPDADSWSRLSLVSTAYFNVEPIVDVPRASFDPPPRVDAGLIRMTRKDDDTSWRSDALVRSYRALFEASVDHTTTARALKSVMVNPNGDAVSSNTPEKRLGNRRNRRSNNMELAALARSFNVGDIEAINGAKPATSSDMLTILRATVDERLLSKPLTGLSNSELRQVCSSISAAINRRKKTI